MTGSRSTHPTNLAAVLLDPADQEATADRPPAGKPTWPWGDEAFRQRLAEARGALTRRG